VLFLTGDLDNPDRDTAGMEKLKSLGVPAKQVILQDAKHGCWMQPVVRAMRGRGGCVVQGALEGSRP